MGMAGRGYTMSVIIQLLLKFCKEVKTIDDESCETVVMKKLLGRWYEVKSYVTPPKVGPDTRWHQTVD
jgi:hypothetical protein